MYRANYPVDNPSDYWKISLYPVFLNYLKRLLNLTTDCSMPIRHIYQRKQILWMRLSIGKSGGLL